MSTDTSPLRLAPRRNLMAALRGISERIRHNYDLEQLLAAMLDALEEELEIGHSLVLLYDGNAGRLYTVASRGYASSGIGSEIPFGEGVIGMAARERTPIRVSHKANAAGAVMSGADASGEIAFPGLPDARSRMALPLLAGPRMIGVLYVESPLEMRFSADEEDLLMALGFQLALSIDILRALGDEAATEEVSEPAQAAGGEPLLVRHYPENDSIFLGDDYLIKGVAGSIFAALVRDCIEKGRTEFTNRELRLDTRIRLPDISDNLEGRLLLLSRRLDERRAGVRIEKTGRGRFRLCIDQPLQFGEAS